MYYNIKIRITPTNDEMARQKTVSSLSSASSYMDYSKILAKFMAPFLDKQEEFCMDVKILNAAEDAGDTLVAHQTFSTFRRSSVVVHDDEPLDMSLNIFQQQSLLPHKMLVMSRNDGSHGNNKFYELKDVADGTRFGACYGRIGESAGSKYAEHAVKPFLHPIYMYWIKYQEKVSKGYKDISDYRELDIAQAAQEAREEENGTSGIKFISNASVRSLVNSLVGFAESTISNNYNIAANQVSDAGFAEARRLIGQLKDEEHFNDTLLNLFHIIPRKMDDVGKFLYSPWMTSSQKEDIIKREIDLLDILESQAKAIRKLSDGSKKQKKRKDFLETFGLEIYEATPEQVETVKDHLGDDLKEKLKKVYRVINRNTQARFEKYLKENGCPKVRQLWHGSRNANWWSILTQGLLLNPNAPITGKMFGQGIYFAPSARKSWGYTSSRGSYWAHGDSNTAYMALFAVAYGDPQEVYTWESKFSDYNSEKFKKEFPGKTCLYAKRDAGMLRNDEIVFYEENQMTINFICEFSA